MTGPFTNHVVIGQLDSIISISCDFRNLFWLYFALTACLSQFNPKLQTAGAPVRPELGKRQIRVEVSLKLIGGVYPSAHHGLEPEAWGFACCHYAARPSSIGLSELIYILC